MALDVQGYTRTTMVGTKRCQPVREAGAHGMVDDWGEVVTR